MSKIAVIDIGTNSIHMVLSEIQPEAGYKILDLSKDGKGFISYDKMPR